MRHSVALLLLCLPLTAAADDTPLDFGGHAKLRAVAQSFPDDSLWRDLVGTPVIDLSGELRLKLKFGAGRWSAAVDGQLLGLHADSLPLTGLPDDDRRLFDLTHAGRERGSSALLQRLDRAWFGYTSERFVMRAGRQALSWGNGLFYAPMDLVNPFDPASIDTEYKAGDDMLYLQYLQSGGNDVQAAWVARRDPASGRASRAQATFAAKYHGFAGEGEYDLLLARSYSDTVVGVGHARNLGGSVWSADLVVTRGGGDTEVQFVSNLAYSWTWGGHNVSGAVEYYFNGFGQRAGRYDPAALAANPELMARLVRGDLYALGRHYVAGSLLIEMTPLWQLTPTALVNVGDPSALLQFVSSYSLADEMTLLASVNLPLGPAGSEFGGIASGTAGRYLASGPGVFAQLAWYF